MGIFIARSSDANDFITARLKFLQQRAISGGTALNLWNIALLQGHKATEDRDNHLPLPSLCDSYSNRKKLIDLSSLSLSKQKRAGYIFCSLHIVEQRKRISWIHTAQTHCWRQERCCFSQHETTTTWQIYIQTILYLTSEATNQGTLIYLSSASINVRGYTSPQQTDCSIKRFMVLI